MTSKEKLKLICNKAISSCDIHNIMEQMGLRTIQSDLEKDLEILDILKKVAIQYETIAEIINFGGKDKYTIGDKNIIFFSLDNKDEYELIKEWLENEK